ncbi:MAG: alpha/beta fold hydrolase [Chloroflexi bacterium]|nr:alpha/beta fold hydrolase [Chloroflexota bacterium]
MRAKRLVQSYLFIGLGSLLIGLWLSACETPATSTPTEPIMQASKTINPILPTARLDNSIGHSDPTSAALAGEGEPSQPAQTPTPLPTLDILPLQAVADDGTVLQFVFYAGRSIQAPTVILLHDAGKNGDEWTSFAMPLHELGYNVFVPDQRGYGDSGGLVDWSIAVADVQALSTSIVRLGLVSPNSIALIGAGTGANLAIAACAQLPTCITAIAVSPQNSADSLDVTTSITALGSRSLLIVSADDDEIGQTVAEQLNSQFSGDHFWQSYTSGGRGTNLLISQPDLPQRIAEWLQTRLAIP